MELALKLFAAPGDPCELKPFFGLPPWYKYLVSQSRETVEGGCNIDINGIYDVFKILAAIIEIALRFGALIAIGMIIFWGIQFIVSQGDPQGIAKARDTVLQAVIGLVIILLSITVISFVAGRF